MKLRADQLLVKRGVVTSRQEAEGLILSGKVSSLRGRVEKVGQLLEGGSILKVEEGQRFVSRGGIKLEHALDEFALLVEGMTCLDVGASTGGFTDCLLQRGAKRVYAIDVGYGQFHWRLRRDPRVVLLERTNFRYLDLERVPEPVDLAVIDVSFISLTRILPKLTSLLREGGRAIVLVKPQFELSPRELKNGVVRSDSLREKAVSRVGEEAKRLGFSILGRTASPLRGPKGNQEYFLDLLCSPKCANMG